MMQALWVALGGALGALARWQTYEILRNHHWPLPLGTLAVNLTGALLLGAFIGLNAEGSRFSEESRLFFTVGVLGALTTFSTFSGEGFRHMQEGLWGYFLAHVALNNLGSFAMVWLGWKIAR